MTSRKVTGVVIGDLKDWAAHHIGEDEGSIGTPNHLLLSERNALGYYSVRVEYDSGEVIVHPHCQVVSIVYGEDNS